MAENPLSFFAPGEYLLGDSAYGVSFPFIVTPYKRPAALKPANARFNYLLSKARIGIEHCIGIMKGRFPILSLMSIYLTDDEAAMRLCNVQRACFILHNICIELKEGEIDVVSPDGNNSDDSDDDDFN